MELYHYLDFSEKFYAIILVLTEALNVFDGYYLTTLVAFGFVHLSERALSYMIHNLVLLQYLGPGGTKPKLLHRFNRQRFLKQEHLICLLILKLVVEGTSSSLAGVFRNVSTGLGSFFGNKRGSTEISYINNIPPNCLFTDSEFVIH